MGAMGTVVGRRHLRAATRWNDVPARWRIATKAALTGFVLLAGAQLAGDLQFGMLATLGAFTVLYGAEAPGRYRLRLLSWVAAGLVTSAVLGGITVHVPWLDVVAIAATAAVATFLCVTFRVGPPGAMFFVLVHGVAGLAAVHGTPVSTIMLATTVGALTAVCGGMSDLVVDPTRPERRAVEAAERALAAFEDALTAPGEAGGARSAASAALHKAWTSVTDAGADPRFTARLWAVQDRYVAASTHVTGVALGLPTAPWGVVAEEMDQEDDTEASAPSPIPSESSRRVEVEKIWDTTLGRPAASTVLRRALRWPSEPLLVVGRVVVAVLVAGTVARALGVEHTHWAVAFATLILHQGGTRAAQTVRGLQRLAGTVLGLLVFLMLHAFDPHGWGLVLMIAGLQFYVEMLVAANYGLAVIGITPLALTIGSAASGGSHPVALAGERAVDTVVAVVVAFASLHLVGRNSGVPILRSYARGVVLGIHAVLTDLQAGRIETSTARENRRSLYVALLESAEHTRRTVADDPQRVGPYRDMEAALSELGYLVLGLAWHPNGRRARLLADRADGPLRRILAHSVRGPRSAEDIHADVRDLRAVVTGWRRQEDEERLP